MRRRIPVLLALILLLMTENAAPAAAEPLVIGDTFTLESARLGETRRINVYLPDAYGAADDARLPVLYMPDGGIYEDFLHVAGLVQISSLNGTMRPFILVGIENTQRRRDMTGPTDDPEDRKIAPEVGGSAAFRAFLKTELIPEIDRRYRTTDERAIVGESLAGLFVVETLLTDPGLFDTYLAFDPSLWWDGGRLVEEAPRLLAQHPGLHATLFLAASDQPELNASARRLAATLRESAPRGLSVEFLDLPGEHHHTIYHPAALAGFRAVFAPPPAE